MAIIYFYVKFCEHLEHAQGFLAGHIYLNTLKFFADLESEEDGRADRYETASQWRQPNDVVVEIAGMTIRGIAAPVVVQEDKPVNVLCLYSGNSGSFDTISEENITAFKQYMQVPERCFEMGKWAVLIKNVAEFNRRMDAEIRRRRDEMGRGPVSYFDGNTYSGAIPQPGFWKRQEFAWQREYRFAVESRNWEPKPLTIELGDLSDICVLVESIKLRELTVGLPNP